jgi:coenzyme Q-binding protein COQ10
VSDPKLPYFQTKATKGEKLQPGWFPITLYLALCIYSDSDESKNKQTNKKRMLSSIYRKPRMLIPTSWHTIRRFMRCYTTASPVRRTLTVQACCASQSLVVASESIQAASCCHSVKCTTMKVYTKAEESSMTRKSGAKLHTSSSSSSSSSSLSSSSFSPRVAAIGTKTDHIHTNRDLMTSHTIGEVGAHIYSRNSLMSKPQHRNLLDSIFARTEFSHRDQQVLPFTVDQFYNVVADVERYQEFLPYVVRSRITRRVSEHAFEAELTVGFAGFTESYTSRVSVVPGKSVHAKCIKSSMFTRLETLWSFKPDIRRLPDGSEELRTLLNFEVHFGVSNALIANVMQTFFHKAQASQTAAFCKRLHTLHSNAPKRIPASPVPAAEAVADTATTTITTPSSSSSSASSCSGEPMQMHPALSHTPLHNLFTNAEIDKIVQLFETHVPAGYMDKDHFFKMCTQVGTRGTLFSRFRDRYVVKALATDFELSCRAYDLFWGPRPVPAHISDGTDSKGEPVASPCPRGVDMNAFAAQLHMLSLVSPYDRLSRLIISRFCGGDAKLANQVSADLQQLISLTEEFFLLQLDVIRQVLPAMVMRRSEELKEAFPSMLEDDADRGMRMLGMLGAMETVLEDMEVTIDDVLHDITSSALPPGSAVSFHDGEYDHKSHQHSLARRSVKSDKMLRLPVHMWLERLEQHTETWEMISVVGFASLIQWAFAIEMAKEPRAHSD